MGDIMKDDFNIIDRFLYKLIIGAFMLLLLVTLDRFKILDIEVVRTELSEHFNILKIVKTINGEKSVFIPIDLTDDVTVSTNAYKNYELIENGAKVFLNDFEGVENYKAGVVVAIFHNSDDTYMVTVKGIDGYHYVYDKLSTLNCSLYKVLGSGDIVGSPSTKNNDNFFQFFVYDKGQVIEILK